MEVMEVGIGEDELGQGPWEEEGSGKCIFLPLNWIHRKPYHKRVSWLRGWALGPGCWGLNPNLATYLGKLLSVLFTICK